MSPKPFEISASFTKLRRFGWDAWGIGRFF